VFFVLVFCLNVSARGLEGFALKGAKALAKVNAGASSSSEEEEGWWDNYNADEY